MKQTISKQKMCELMGFQWIGRYTKSGIEGYYIRNICNNKYLYVGDSLQESKTMLEFMLNNLSKKEIK